jgi:hypothetical protein
MQKLREPESLVPLLLFLAHAKVGREGLKVFWREVTTE